MSGFFPKCTKYKLVFFDTLVRLVFFSLPTLANSQGFAYNLTSNFHEIQLPNSNVSGLGFRVPEKFCESSPLWRHVFLGRIKYSILQLLLINIFCKDFLLINNFCTAFFVDQHFSIFFEIFC